MSRWSSAFEWLLPQLADRVVLLRVDGPAQEIADVAHRPVGSPRWPHGSPKIPSPPPGSRRASAIEPFKLDAMRRAGELIAYRPEGSREHYYPLWQFDEEWQPLPIIPQLVREAEARACAGTASTRC